MSPGQWQIDPVTGKLKLGSAAGKPIIATTGSEPCCCGGAGGPCEWPQWVSWTLTSGEYCLRRDDGFICPLPPGYNGSSDKVTFPSGAGFATIQEVEAESCVESLLTDPSPPGVCYTYYQNSGACLPGGPSGQSCEHPRGIAIQFSRFATHATAYFGATAYTLSGWAPYSLRPNAQYNIPLYLGGDVLSMASFCNQTLGTAHVQCGPPLVPQPSYISECLECYDDLPRRVAITISGSMCPYTKIRCRDRSAFGTYSAYRTSETHWESYNAAQTYYRIPNPPNPDACNQCAFYRTAFDLEPLSNFGRVRFPLLPAYSVQVDQISPGVFFGRQFVGDYIDICGPNIGDGACSAYGWISALVRFAPPVPPEGPTPQPLPSP